MNRNQKKWIKKINTSISPDRAAAEFAVVGKTSQGLTQKATIALGIFGAVVVGGLLIDVVLVPGALFFVWLFREMKPPRLVTVSRHEICSYSQGFFNNSPAALVGVVPLVPLQPSADGAEVIIGAEAVKFQKKEYAQLLEATHQLVEANHSEANRPQMRPPVQPPAMAAPIPQIFS